MKNFFKIFGVIALVAVTGFGVASCGGSGGSSNNDVGNSGAKTLVIQNIPNNINEYTIDADDSFVLLYTAGTPTSQVSTSFTNCVAAAFLHIAQTTTNVDGTTTGSIPLYYPKAGNTWGSITDANITNQNRWTGSGTYDVYLSILYNDQRYTLYKASSVAFSSGGATVPFSRFQEIEIP